MKGFYNNLKYFTIFFIVLFLFYYPKKYFKTIDTVNTRLLPISILIEKNLNLDEFYGKSDNYLKENKNNPYAIYFPPDSFFEVQDKQGNIFYHPWIITIIDNHIYSTFPYVYPILNLPFYVVFGLFFDLKQISFLDISHPLSPLNQLDNFIAAFWTALSAVLLFYYIYQYINQKVAYIILLIYVFASPALSLLSHNTWQHTLIVNAVLLLLILLKKDSKYSALAIGMILGILPHIRPTTIFFYPLILLNFKKEFIKYYIIGFLLLNIPFDIINLMVYDHIVGPYYHHFRIIKTLESKVDFLGVFLGLLVSPSRGLFLFLPYLLLLFLIPFKWKSWNTRKKEILVLLFIIIVYIFYYSTYHIWHGGWQYGPRFFTDLLPIFMILLAEITWAYDQNKIYKISLFLLSLVAFFIHIQPNLNMEFLNWDTCYLKNKDHVQKIWDWEYPVFLLNVYNAQLFWKEQISIKPEFLCINPFYQISYKNDAVQYNKEQLIKDHKFFLKDYLLFGKLLYLPKGKYRIELYEKHPQVELRFFYNKNLSYTKKEAGVWELQTNQTKDNTLFFYSQEPIDFELKELLIKKIN
jgi:hypothetical protein